MPILVTIIISHILKLRDIVIGHKLLKIKIIFKSNFWMTYRYFLQKSCTSKNGVNRVRMQKIGHLKSIVIQSRCGIPGLDHRLDNVLLLNVLLLITRLTYVHMHHSMSCARQIHIPLGQYLHPFFRLDFGLFRYRPQHLRCLSI